MRQLPERWDRGFTSIIFSLKVIMAGIDPKRTLGLKMEKELSIIFNLELGELPSKERKGYIFAYTKGGVGLTAYIKNGFLYYGIPEIDPLKIMDKSYKGDDENLFLKTPITEFLNTPHLLSFYYSVKNQDHEISISIDNIKKAEKSLSHIIDTDFMRFFYSVGGSMENDDFGIFKLFEHMMFSRILNEKELKDIYQDQKDKSELSYLNFEGEQFMYKDLVDNNLKQDDKKRQPKYVSQST